MSSSAKMKEGNEEGVSTEVETRLRQIDGTKFMAVASTFGTKYFLSSPLLSSHLPGSDGKEVSSIYREGYIDQ